VVQTVTCHGQMVPGDTGYVQVQSRLGGNDYAEIEFPLTRMGPGVQSGMDGYAGVQNMSVGLTYSRFRMFPVHTGSTFSFREFYELFQSLPGFKARQPDFALLYQDWGVPMQSSNVWKPGPTTTIQASGFPAPGPRPGDASYEKPPSDASQNFDPYPQPIETEGLNT
jgi:hypothetical protein